MYYCGNSSNKEIFELVLWLIYFEIRGCFRLHIIGVVGTRQIAAEFVLKGLFDRRNSLIWLYFILCAFELEIIWAFDVTVAMVSDMY